MGSGENHEIKKLIEIALKDDRPLDPQKVYSDKELVEEFIFFNKLKAGKKPVKAILIYNLFVQQTGNKDLYHNNFFEVLRNNFPYKRQGRGYFYYFEDRSVFDESRKEWKKAYAKFKEMRRGRRANLKRRSRKNNSEKKEEFKFKEKRKIKKNISKEEKKAIKAFFKETEKK